MGYNKYEIEVDLVNPDDGVITSLKGLLDPQGNTIYKPFYIGSMPMLPLFVDDKLTVSECRVFFALASCIQKDNIALYRPDLYAQYTKLSEITVKRAITELVKKNIIRLYKRKRGLSLYRVNPHLLWYGHKDEHKHIAKEDSIPNIEVKMPSFMINFLKQNKLKISA